MAEAYDISGTAGYAGSKSGRVYLTVYTASGPMGTSIPAPGPFTIRGVPTGTYMITAFMDALGTGSRHVSDPFGSISPVTVITSPLSGINITLTDPAQLTTIQPPTGLRAFPGDSAALAQWNFLDTGNGSEADSYSIYYDTNPSVTPANAAFSKLDIPADGDQTDLLLSGLANGNYYFIITAKSGSVTSSPSAVVGPVAIGPLTGGYSVSGSVTLPAVTATGPLYLAIADKAGNHFPAYINSPVSPQAFAVNGVPNGTYQVFAVLDMNNNGLIDTGDFKTSDLNAPIITVSNGAVTNADVVIDTAGSAVNVMTQHMNDGAGESYALNFNIYDGFKRPVTVTINSGPNISGPIDIGLSNSGGFFSYINIGPVIPAVNDSYSFAVGYSDGTSETISGMVTGVVTALATPTAPTGNTTYNSSQIFTWAAPINAAPPANSTYVITLNEQNGPLNWNSGQIPISQTSAAFNFDGTASQSSLIDGKIYDWGIAIFDPQGNFSANNTSFSFPGTGGITPVTLPDTIEFSFYYQQLAASGGNGSYSWSVVSGALPSGLTLDPTTGIISGYPGSGTNSFTIQVTDTALPPFTAANSYSIYVIPSGVYGPPIISTPSLPDSAVNSFYNQTIGVYNGTPPYTFTYSGSLPPGLTLSPSGQLSGTTTSTGSYPFTVTVQDAAFLTGSMAYTITVGASSGSISGNISYNGSSSGRIYITVQTNNGTLGTSINWPTETTYTIRGVPNGSYTLNAYMDSLNIGTRVQMSPDGSAATILSGSDVSGLTITLTDLLPIAPAAPTNVSASPGDSSIIIGWDPARSNGTESADSYDIYWGTSAAVSKISNSGSMLNVLPGVDSPTIVSGLTNGSSLYFVIVPKSGGVEGLPSTAIGPITIGAPSGGNTVSGTVNYSGVTPTGPLYVLVVNPLSKGADAVYFTKVINPSTVNNFSVSGIPNGSYIVYSVFDLNNNNQFGVGDSGSTDYGAPSITVSGSGLTGLNMNLNAMNTEAAVTTNHGKPAIGTGEWFTVDGDLNSQLKRAVAVTLTGAPASMQLPLPMDIGLNNEDGGRFHFWANSPVRPTAGDTYTFTVTYADGTVDSAVTAFITGVIDSFPTAPQISTPTSTVPTFSWSAPTIPPASYLYSIWVGGSFGGNYWDSWDIPSSMTAITYGSAGNQAQPLLLNSQYNWNIGVRDQNGNQATISSSFTPTVAPLVATMSWGAVFHLTKDDGTEWDVLDLGTTATATALGAMTAVVSGPNGFSYSFTDADRYPFLNGQLAFTKLYASTSPLAPGSYTFTFNDGLGNISTRVDTHVAPLLPLPAVDSTTIQMQRKADGSYRITWAPVNDTVTYYYRARIQKADGSDTPVYLGARTMNGFEDIPLNAVIDGTAYQVRIEVSDSPTIDLLFNRSNSALVNFTPQINDYDPNRLMFSYSSAYNRFEANGSQLYTFGFGFGTATDAAKVTSAVVTGPNGFSYTFQPADLAQPNGIDFVRNDSFTAQPPQPGLYTFHVMANGIDHVAYNTLTAQVAYPLPVVTTYQAEDPNNGSIRFSWADVNHNGALYYRVFVQDTVSGQYFASGRLNQIYAELSKTLLGDLTTKNWRVEVYDSSSGITVRNRINGAFTPLAVPAYDAARPTMNSFGIMNDIQSNGLPVTNVWMSGTDTDGTITELRVDGPNGYSRNLLTQGKPDSSNSIYRLFENGSPQSGLYTFTLTDNAGNSVSRYNYQPIAHNIPAVDFKSVKINTLPNGDVRLSWAPVYSDVPLWYMLQLFTNTDTDGNGLPDPLAIPASQIGTLVTLSSVVIPATYLPSLNQAMFRISAYDGSTGLAHNNRSRSAYVGYQGDGFDYSALTDTDGDGFAANVDSNDNNAASYPFAPVTTPLITWAAPAAITYGTSLSTLQLNATASVPGTFAYSPAAGTILNAGSQTLTVTFTPTDFISYSTATATVNLAVNQATPLITWAAPAAVSYGTPLTAAQQNAAASVPGAFVYAPIAGTVLNAGTQTLNATFTPTDAANYTTAAATVSLTINPLLLTVTANSASKTYGAANPLLTVAYSGFAGTDTAADLTTQPTVSTPATTTSPAGTYPITASGGAASNYTFTYIPGTLTINPTVINLTASATTGGAVTPPGTTAVNSGTSQSYTITANPGYHILDVKVDGISQGAIATYSFTNVTTPHTIDATFAVNTFTITATAGTFGNITPTGTKTLNQGASQSYTITPDSGYVISDVKIDGVPLDRSVVGPLDNYTISNLSADHTIEAYFAPDGILDPNNITGIPSINDALIALKIVMENETPTSSQILHADAAPLVNGVPHPDGKIDFSDVLLILRRVVGLVKW